MANTTEPASGGQQPSTGRPSTSRSRRRVKVLAWRAALGAAYTAGGVAVTFIGRWLLTLL